MNLRKKTKLKTEVVVNLLDLMAFLFITPEISKRMNYVFSLTIPVGAAAIVSMAVAGATYWLGDNVAMGDKSLTIIVAITFFIIITPFAPWIINPVVKSTSLRHDVASRAMVLIGCMLFTLSRIVAILHALYEP